MTTDPEPTSRQLARHARPRAGGRARSASQSQAGRINPNRLAVPQPSPAATRATPLALRMALLIQTTQLAEKQATLKSAAEGKVGLVAMPEEQLEDTI